MLVVTEGDGVGNSMDVDLSEKLFQEYLMQFILLILSSMYAQDGHDYKVSLYIK